MAMRGHDWQYDHNELIEKIKKHEGKAIAISQECGICYNTLMKYIKRDDSLMELMNELRNSYSTKLLDKAENVLEYAMDSTRKDLGNALKASFFVLNNKGEERGYSLKNNPNNPQGNGVTRDDLKDFFESTKNTGSVSGTVESKQQEMENEQPILD